MAKFRWDDRVRCVYQSDDPDYGSGNGEHFRIGDVGTVLDLCGTDFVPGVEVYLVCFDTRGYMYCHEEELKLDTCDGLLDV